MAWIAGKSVSLGGETPLHDGERDVPNGNRFNDREILPPPPPLPPSHRFAEMRDSVPTAQAAISNPQLLPPPPRDDDIFEGVGTDYVPTVRESDSPQSEDMEESPGRDNERPSYFSEHYGPMPPQDANQGWQHQVCIDFLHLTSLTLQWSTLCTSLDSLCTQ
jgi:hypothetical protein